MGSMVAFVGATEKGFSVAAGVANAGDEEGIGFEAEAKAEALGLGVLASNMGAWGFRECIF
jgi:hypothetical protein